MNRFVQLHLLTSYPPSNLNRDDTGRPKTAVVGGANRLRISSQSLKRAWRTSDEFGRAFQGNLGVRTKRLGIDVYRALLAGGIGEKHARQWARLIAQQFGALESSTADDKDLTIKQLAHIGPEEREAVDALAALLIQRKTEPTEAELKLLRHPARAVDIAMFGRMLADAPDFNVEAAVQVAHAMTVHAAAVDDDYFSAVDDLSPRDTTGAAHIGERGFGAGVFYLYLTIDRESLLANLAGDAALARRALAALVQAACRVSPTGMQNSYASRAYAGYVLAEKGDQQPRTLAQAFLEPVRGQGEGGVFESAVRALQARVDNFDKVYGPCADARITMNVEAGEGSLDAIVAFASE